MILIRSGAQTGADRAALDAALAAGVECGGWCPEGRKAEDGRIPEHYPVSELTGADYRNRTLRNVIDSTGSIIFYFGAPTGGTEQTLVFCIARHRPYLLIDASELSENQAATHIATFVKQHEITDLNIAGARASEEPRIYGYVYKTIGLWINNA